MGKYSFGQFRKGNIQELSTGVLNRYSTNSFKDLSSKEKEMNTTINEPNHTEKFKGQVKKFDQRMSYNKLARNKIKLKEDQNKEKEQSKKIIQRSYKSDNKQMNDALEKERKDAEKVIQRGYKKKNNIQELSATTLHRYITKASRDYDYFYTRPKGHREKDIGLAMNKIYSKNDSNIKRKVKVLATEENISQNEHNAQYLNNPLGPDWRIQDPSNIQELSHKILKRYIKKAKDEVKTSHNGNKIRTRYKGIHQAKEKLAETNNIQELSKKTLGRYIRKATDDIQDMRWKIDTSIHPFEAGHAYPSAGSTRAGAQSAGHAYPSAGSTRGYLLSKKDKRDLRKIENRRTGIHKAVNKLTKEENIQELSKGTLKRYIAKRTRPEGYTGVKPPKDGNVQLAANKIFLKKANKDPNKGPVAKVLAKEENIQELSKGTLKRYLKKIDKDPKRSHMLVNKSETLATSKIGKGYSHWKKPKIMATEGYSSVVINDLPQILIFKRQSIRSFPDGTLVGQYFNSELNQTVTVSYKADKPQGSLSGDHHY